MPDPLALTEKVYTKIKSSNHQPFYAQKIGDLVHNL